MDTDEIVDAWIASKRGRSDSAKTEQAYRAVLVAFRAHLADGGLQPDSPSADVAAAASVFAGSSNKKKSVSPATYNQRLAILSSFYQFAHRRQLLSVANPIALVERRPIQGYAESRALEYEDVRRRLTAIDRTTPAGLRDYALLAVLLQTGRRSMEVATLQRSDVSGDTILFRRCKGGKQMIDRVPHGVASAVDAWRNALENIPQKNTFLWISLAPGSVGAPLGHGAIAAICTRRLGTSRVHSTRHTFARAMEDAGAKVSDIQARLGHASLATTGRYLQALRSAENAHSTELASLLGLDR